jgi:hypothetical protein
MSQSISAPSPVARDVGTDGAVGGRLKRQEITRRLLGADAVVADPGRYEGAHNLRASKSRLPDNVVD